MSRLADQIAVTARLVQEAELAHTENIKNLIKPDDLIEHNKGGKVQAVQVTRVSGDHILVYNPATGKEYWIGSWFVL